MILNRISKFLIVFTIIFSWVFSGWPQILELNNSKVVYAAVETRRPTSHTDSSANTTNPTNAYDIDGGTFSTTDYGSNSDPSITFDAWQSTAFTYTSTYLKVRYHADAGVDDTYAIAYSTSGCGGAFTDLVAYTFAGSGDTTVSSVNLGGSPNLANFCVKIYADKVKGPDRSNVYIRDIWVEGIYNSPPNAPTQNSPSNGATDVSITPTFTMTATDPDSDDLGYKVTIYDNSGCSSVVQTNDQSVSATGWTGTDASCTNNPTSCYASGTQGSYTTQSSLSNNTQYWWKASAKDPDGIGSFTDSATCNTFTTIGAANSLPVASAVSIDSDAASITLIENNTKNVVCEGTVTDNDGYANITSVTADFYRTSVGTGGGEDDNNYYQLLGDSECIPSGGSGNSETYTCTFTVQYFADPTDAGSPNSGDDWTCLMTPSDAVGAGTTDFDVIEMDSLVALDVTSSIAYGILNPNTDTGATNQQTTITNTGNRDMDPQLSGTDMTCSGNTIVVGSQKYSANPFTYSGGGTVLTTTPAALDIALAQRTNTEVTDTVSWGIGIPDGTPACDPYTGTNTFSAIVGI